MELDRTDQEPSLGAPESRKAGSQEHWASGAGDDREGDPGCDDREPDVDGQSDGTAKPSLGWNDGEAEHSRYPSQMGVQP